MTMARRVTPVEPELSPRKPGSVASDVRVVGVGSFIAHKGTDTNIRVATSRAEKDSRPPFHSVPFSAVK